MLSISILPSLLAACIPTTWHGNFFPFAIQFQMEAYHGFSQTTPAKWSRHESPPHHERIPPSTMTSKSPIPPLTSEKHHSHSVGVHSLKHAKHSLKERHVTPTTVSQPVPPTIHASQMTSRSDGDSSPTPSVSDQDTDTKSSPESPANIPTTESDPIDTHLSSPSKDFTSYSHLISHMPSALISRSKNLPPLKWILSSMTSTMRNHNL